MELVVLVGVLSGVVLAGVGFRGFVRSSYVYRLESQIPQVLRVVSDAVAAGMDLKSAVESAARLSTGPMSRELRRVISLCEVGGLTVEEALWRVASGVPSANFRRFALILTEAARSGARLPEVLDIAARSFAAVVEYRSALVSQLRPYVALFYAVVVVFVLLADVLLYVLLPQLATFAVGGAAATAAVDRSEVLRALFLSGAVGGVVGGLAVGRVVYNAPLAGLLHGGIGVVLVGGGLWVPTLLTS